jgi:hypothetical protein
MPLYRRQIIKPTADLDAVAYIGKVGITDVVAQNAINDFVLGIKNLGLWSSIVSWPLRSTQNAGTGTTAYSLGGLQTSNGTLTGATWTSLGVSFSGSTQFMSSDLTNIPKDATLFISAKGNGNTYSQFAYLGGVFASAGYLTSMISFGNATAADKTQTIVLQPSGFLNTSTINNGLSGASSFVALSGSYKRNTVFNARNLSESTVATQASYLADEATTITKMLLNGRWEGATAAQGNPMTSSFFAIITPNCDSVISSFHTLYKNTLGAGLGLP